MVKELNKILRELDKIYRMLEKAPDMGDTSVVYISDIKKTDRLLDKLCAKVDALSGEVADLIKIEKEK